MARFRQGNSYIWPNLVYGGDCPLSVVYGAAQDAVAGVTAAGIVVTTPWNVKADQARLYSGYYLWGKIFVVLVV